MKIKFLFCISLLLFFPLLASSADDEKDERGLRVYIVYLDDKHARGKTPQEIEGDHHSYLVSLKKSQEEARDSILYSYKHSLNGFAALLSPDEASKLSEREGVVSVLKSKSYRYKLATTRTWDFLGLDEAGDASYPEAKKIYGPGREMLKKAKHGKDIIIGMIDSGIWPESRSFSDEGMTPVPESWQGICETGPGFDSSHCNRKIIGARYYMKGFIRASGPLPSYEYPSPRDSAGHGSHTASTAAGRITPNVSAYGGLAEGTASGGAPLARLAIYKACWALPDGGATSCAGEDILAAVDQAVADGVDVLSISIVFGNNQVPYTQTPLAIGTLHATRKNIIVACSAGNDGPARGSLSNTQPWVITVAASSSDRMFFSDVVLGNGRRISGQSITTYKMDRERPLVFAAEVGAYGTLPQDAEQCLRYSLAPELVRGRVVLCLMGQGDAVEKSLEVKRADGVGLILGSFPGVINDIFLSWNYLPSSFVTPQGTTSILNYIIYSRYPTAFIRPAETVINHARAPYMARFSSRGPNTIDPSLLKPDVTAPGVNVLAAWSGVQPISAMPGDTRFAEYNFDSGTSMSCPHVAAVAALLKAIHPDWSSAAIRSAIMTTASTKNNMNEPITDEEGNTATPFHYGSGHIRPAKASDPGLVYDASYEDYIQYLCSIKERTSSCPETFSSPLDLNYPSISIPELRGTVTVNRTVTNVGPGNKRTEYKVQVSPPPGVTVEVSPEVLVFDRVGQKKSFTIRVQQERAAGGEGGEYGHRFGWYSWSDGTHDVRSPISVMVA